MELSLQDEILYTAYPDCGTVYPQLWLKNSNDLDCGGAWATESVVRADHKLTAFVELERAIHKVAVSLARKRVRLKS